MVSGGYACAIVGFLLVQRFPPTVQTPAGLVKWKLEIAHRCCFERECVWLTRGVPCCHSIVCRGNDMLKISLQVDG